MNIENREYIINIDPRILELLGPALYTNVYYVLAELIANAYDANAANVYIIEKDGQIIVEDDGVGMSYKNHDIHKYLNVAVETRTKKEDVYVEGSKNKRKRIGRKGIGKLAALSISSKVLVMTKKNREKSGFVLSRYVDDDHRLEALSDEDIKFEKITGTSGTSIVMTEPEYGLHKSVSAIKNNLLKTFPLINNDFKIHIETPRDEVTIDNFDKEIIQGLGALIILGKDFYHLSKYFDPGLPEKIGVEKKLLEKREIVNFPLNLKNRKGEKKDYNLQIRGWIGAYRTTRGRKKDPSDFPDNFISLLAYGKLGEYNILPKAGKNKLQEVYIVGQLHVDLFEETELPDIALSNRQGYKTENPRYIKVIDYVRETLLPQIVKMRGFYADYVRLEKEKGKLERQKKSEKKLRKKVEEYERTVSLHVGKEIAEKLGGKIPERIIREMIRKDINLTFPIIGIKKKVDSQKKKILMCHTETDKPLADVIYKMLLFNNVPGEDMIYTNSDDEECRIPEGINVFDYLREFFVKSYSTENIYVIYVTSKDMARSWFAVTEVGAGWIVRSRHKIFNVYDHDPQRPLDIDADWQTSIEKGDIIEMNSVEFDKFVVKIIDICKFLGYKFRNKKDNKKELARYVVVK